MKDLKIFENADFGQIRTCGTSEEPLFCLSDICKALGLTASKVAQRLEDDVLSKHPIFDKMGRKQIAMFVTEDGLYDVILESRKPEAKKFRKWITSEVLPSIRKTGRYETETTSIQTKMEVAEWAARMLNMNNAGRLMMVKHITDQCGMPTPDYVQSEGVTKSASELCKEHNLPVSGRWLLALMVDKGLAQIQTRTSSKGELKKFKSLTAEGLKWGENAVHPMNPKETQILLYVDRFSELVKFLHIEERRTA